MCSINHLASPHIFFSQISIMYRPLLQFYYTYMCYKEWGYDSYRIKILIESTPRYRDNIKRGGHFTP